MIGNILLVIAGMVLIPIICTFFIWFANSDYFGYVLAPIMIIAILLFLFYISHEVLAFLNIIEPFLN